MLKSILRYPGGKAKVVKFIIEFFKDIEFSEYREPFLGGGSVFLFVKQLINSNASYILSDKNEDLIFFWKEVKNNSTNLVNILLEIKEKWDKGKELYYWLNNIEGKMSDFEKAFRFFILNRITFSGLADSGGFSNESFEKRFTYSSINKLIELSTLLKNVDIQCCDYKRIIDMKGKDVFIYLDPPYYNNKKSKLYGKQGQLHASFNHKEFADTMKHCEHNWLVTCDNSKNIKEWFNYAETIIPITFQYGMDSFTKDKNAKIGKELIITNFKLDEELIYKRFRLWNSHILLDI